MTWENFTYEEFACSHTGENLMSEKVIDDLQKLRTTAGIPFIITSGYRSPNHPVEAAKNAPGSHSTGLAVDILCAGKAAYGILTLAIAMNLEEDEAVWSGIGINQKGDTRFIHLDQLPESDRRPWIWSY